MKTRLRKSALKFTTPLVIAGALFLAGCGGSDAPQAPAPVVELTPAQKAVNAAEAAVDGITPASTREQVEAAGEAIATAREEIGKLAFAERAAPTETVEGLAEKLALTERLTAIDAIAKANEEAMDPVNIALLDAAITAAEAAIANVPAAHRAAYTAQLGGSKADLMTAKAAREAMELADRRTAQMADLASASASLQAALTALAGATPTQEQLTAADTALTALKNALAGAMDLDETEKARYQLQADNAVAPIATAQGRFDTAEEQRLAALEEERIKSEVAGVQMHIDAAKEAVAGLDVSSTDEEVAAARGLIATAETAIADANIPDKSTLLADLAMQKGALGAKETAIAEHQEQQRMAEEQRQIAEIVETLQGDVDAAETAVAGLTNNSSDEDVEAAETAIKAAKDAIDAAEIPDADKSALRAALAAQERVLAAKETAIAEARKAEEDRKAADARKAQEEEDRKAAEAKAKAAEAMAATAAKLYARIATPVGNPNSPAANDRAAAYNNVDTPDSGDAVDTRILVSIGTADAAGTAIELLEDKKATVANNHGWKGKRYADAAGGDMVEALVWSNVEAPTMGKKFGSTADVPADGSGAFQYQLTAQGVLTGVTLDATAAARVALSGVTRTAGTETFELPDPNPNQIGAITVSGSFHGVAGTYTCATTAGTACTALVAAEGFTLGGGTAGWTFTPADANARVMSAADTVYASYGWWLHKTENGQTFTASAFHDFKGTTGEASNTLDLLGGTATYVGGAAGKYALSSALPGGTNDAGHFTARATLEADFGDDMITGTIDQFMGGDDQSRPWSVELKETSFTPATGIFTNSDKGTAWTIDGTAAATSGDWVGQLRNEGDDGVPKVATGTFYTEYGTAGRMVGGFGANKQ